MRLGLEVFAALVLSLLSAMSHSQSYRAMWVDAFHAGFRNPDEVDVLLRRASTAKLNALFVQMRARAATYHQSRYDPPAHDKDPGYDALADILHKCEGLPQPMEVHAWMNAHPLWPATHDPPFREHVVLRRPEWLTKNRSGQTDTDVGRALDFGHPKAADYLWRTYLEVARKYPVAGIHMDFIRYTGSDWGYNAESVARFNRRYGRTGTPEADDPAWQQWRRDQVTALVRKVYATATALRWDIEVSAALVPWGQAPAASRPWEETRAYREVFSDWKAWLQEGSLDIGMPMWYVDGKRLPQYLPEWLEWAKTQRFPVAVVAGLGAYLNPPADTLEQIRMVAEALPFGFCLFSYASTSDRGEGIRTYEEEVYRMLGESVSAVPAPPDLSWKRSPEWGIVHGTVLDPQLNPLDGATVSLVNAEGREVTTSTDGTGFYAFLRVPPGRYAVRVTSLTWPTLEIGGVSAFAGASIAAHGIVGPPSDLTRRTGMLRRLSEGASVCLSGLRVVRTEPLTLRDPIGGGEVVAVESAPPDLPWLVGDVVAVRGVLAIREGSVFLQNATLALLGIER